MRRLTLLVLFVGAAVPAAAQEAAGGLNPFSGNVGNAIWTLVIFLLVLVVLGKFAWGPVLRLLQDREEFIHRALSDAKRDRQDADTKLKDISARLHASHAEAAALIDQARRDASRLRDDLRQRAQAEAETILQNARRQIQLETQRAVQQIRHEAVDLSVMIASKIIQKNLSKDDNDRLIDDALKQVDGGLN